MRKLLYVIAYGSLIGSLIDGLITLVVIWFILNGEALISLNVNDHLRDHLPFLYWVRDLAEVLFPNRFVEWLFSLPALVYFPVRVFVSIVIGALALWGARSLN